MRCPGQSHGISEKTLLPKGWSVPFVTKGTFWLKWLLPFKSECPAQETASYLLQMWGRRGTRPMCAGAATLPTRQHILDNNGGSHRGMWTNRRRQSNMSNRFLQDPSRRIINRGCSSHRSHNRNFFKSLEPTSRNILISNSECNGDPKQGIQNVKTQSKRQSKRPKMWLMFSYAPSLSCNMLNVSALDKKGLAVHFEKNKCHGVKDGVLYAEANLDLSSKPLSPT